MSIFFKKKINRNMPWKYPKIHPFPKTLFYKFERKKNDLILFSKLKREERG